MLHTVKPKSPELAWREFTTADINQPLPGEREFQHFTPLAFHLHHVSCGLEEIQSVNPPMVALL